MFRHGEVDRDDRIGEAPQAELARLAIDAPLGAARAVMNFNRAWWKLLVKCLWLRTRGVT